MKKIQLELIMGLGALACFAGFWALRSGWNEDSTSRAVMAEVTEGAPRVRAWGETAYATREVGASIYELDLVWAPESGGAVLKLKRGGFLDLPGGALVVMKRPFRQGWIETEDTQAPPFRTLSGSPQVVETAPAPKSVSVPRTAAPTGAPAAAPSAAVAPGARVQNLYPAPGAIFFLVDKDSTRVTFTWDAGLRATQWVLNGQVTAVANGMTSSSPVTLHANQSEWNWELRDSEGKTVSGPHRFRVQKLKQAELDQAVSAAGLESVFYIE